MVFRSRKKVILFTAVFGMATTAHAVTDRLKKSKILGKQDQE